MGSQRYPQHLGVTTLLVLQTTIAAVSIFANQPLTNRAGRPFSSLVAETLLYADNVQIAKLVLKTAAEYCLANEAIPKTKLELFHPVGITVEKVLQS